MKLITTNRLTLEPRLVSHAQALSPILVQSVLYEFLDFEAPPATVSIIAPPRQ
jgi:hypothetical protein